MKSHTPSDSRPEGGRQRCETIPLLDLGDLPAEAEGLFLIDTPEALFRALDHDPLLAALAGACESK